MLRPRDTVEARQQAMGIAGTAVEPGSGRRAAPIISIPAVVAVIGAVLAGLVWTGSWPDGLGAEARRTLAITVLGLGLWGAWPQRAFWPSVLVIGLLLASRVAVAAADVPSQMLALYGSSGVWTPLTGFLLAHAVGVTGLGRRIAFAIVRQLGRRPSLVVLAVGVASLFVAPLSPSTTAKAFLLAPIAVALVEAYQAKPGSRFGSAVLLMAAAANNIGASMFLTATIPNFISAQYLDAVGVQITWLRWLALAGPPNVLLFIVAWLALVVIRRPEAEVGTTIGAARGLLKETAAPISREELATAAALVIALLAWTTEPITGLNGGLIGLVAALALFVPPLRAVRPGQLREAVPWGPVALFFAALLLGSAISNTRAFDPLVEAVFRTLGIAALPVLPAVAVVTIVALFGHLAFTSTTAYATVIVPVAISIAVAGGLPPEVLALPVAITIGYAFMLPMNTIPNVIMLDTGYFTPRQMLVYGTALTVAAAAILLLVALPWWRLLGAIPAGV